MDFETLWHLINSIYFASVVSWLLSRIAIRSLSEESTFA